MPYLEVNTSLVLSDAEKHTLCEEIGKYVPLIHGKRREIMMMNISEGRYIELGEPSVQTEPCLNLEVRICGISPYNEKRDFVREVTAMLEEKFGLQPGRTFINIVEHPSWGAFGNYHDNNILDPSLYD